MKPILFNTQMVQAILDGRKTTTRRIIKNVEPFGKVLATPKGIFSKEGLARHGQYHIGDILYVRETWKLYEKRFGKGEQCHLEKFYGYKADENNPKNPSEFYDGNWKPSIHMPKDAARIFLKVTSVKVERLQDITDDGCKAEGCYMPCYEVGTNKEKNDKTLFKIIWDSTLKKEQIDQYGWNTNPWVWVIEFERCEKPNEE